MLPVICKIGPLSIYSYGLMLVIAFFLGTFLAARYAKTRGVDAELIWNFSFVCTISGIIGARIFYVVENFSYYASRPLEIFILPHGGLSWFGGLILGGVCGTVYLKKKKAPFLLILDIMAPFVALAQSIGRIGCFLNGCCFGKESVWGVYSPILEKTLIPTQLYASAALLAIFVVLRILSTKKLPAGSILYAYLFLYSIKRFLIEFWRSDNPIVFAGLTLFQLLSIAVFIFSIIQFFCLRKKV